MDSDTYLEEQNGKRLQSENKLYHQGGHTELAGEEILKFPGGPQSTVEGLKQG